MIVIQPSKVWKELKEWKSNWKKSMFFKALVFGLSTSLFDCGADFYFAWTVPEDCGIQDVHDLDFTTYVSTPCGTTPYEGVEAWTYTAIALPGILLGISGIQRLMKHIASKCWPGHIHWFIRGSVNVISLALEVLFCVMLLIAAAWKNRWTNMFPTLGYMHSIAIKVLACLSAIFIIGVKFLGLFSHGPETSRLILRVTDLETKYEACLQLLNVGNIFMTSAGIGTYAELLSGLSSLTIIGKVGVLNLLEMHKKQVSKCSIWGKIVLPATALPVFLLVTVFKIGSLAVMSSRERTIVMVLGFAASSTTLLILKMCRSKNDQVLTSINQSILAELFTLHQWPKGRLGRAVGVGMTTFVFLLYSSSLAWHIANPEELTKINRNRKSDLTFQEWRSETTDRLQVTAACFLGLGLFTFILVICFILFQDKLVTTALSKFSLKNSEDKGDAIIEIGQIQTLNEDNKEEEEEKEERGEEEDGVNKDES